MSDSPFRKTSIDKVSCRQCGAPAVSILWDPAAPFSTVHVGCSASCGLTPGIGDALSEDAQHTLDAIWRLSAFGISIDICNADFKVARNGRMND